MFFCSPSRKAFSSKTWLSNHTDLNFCKKQCARYGQEGQRFRQRGDVSHGDLKKLRRASIKGSFKGSQGPVFKLHQGLGFRLVV